MDGQILKLELAAPQKHRYQADPGKDKKKTRRAEAAGLRSVAAVCERGIRPAPLGYRLSRLACAAIRCRLRFLTDRRRRFTFAPYSRAKQRRARH
jgi:hypothetical protein